MDISETEKTLIQKQIEEIISYNEDIPVNSVHAEQMVRDWLKAKEVFIERFGGLVYEVPGEMSFSLDGALQTDRIYDLCDSIQNIWQNKALADFIFDQRRGFMENTVIADTLAPDGVEIKVGAKLLKSFKHYEKDVDKLKQIQDAASMIIQEGKITGKLCISVHPLDFLSSSENTYHWRSCHALDGDYRAGNFSYMLDSCTVIVYLKGEDDATLPNFPPQITWNSKKWRMLLHVSDSKEEFIAGRQYPFFIDSILDKITECLLPIISSSTHRHIYLDEFNKWSKYYMLSITKPNEEPIHLYDKYIVFNNDLWPLNEVVHEGEGSLMFDDILYSSCYTPYYCNLYHSHYISKPVQRIPVSFTIGHSVRCPCCGERNVEESSSFLCYYCMRDLKDDTDIIFCDSCGTRIHDEYEVYWIDDSRLCEDCCNRYTVPCYNCGEFHYKENMKYSNKVNSYLCIDCDFEEDD